MMQSSNAVNKTAINSAAAKAAVASNQLNSSASKTGGVNMIATPSQQLHTSGKVASIMRQS